MGKLGMTTNVLAAEPVPGGHELGQTDASARRIVVAERPGRGARRPGRRARPGRPGPGGTAEPVTRRLEHGGRRDGTEVECTDYRQDGHPLVTLYTIHGGGHVIPGPRRAPRIMGRTTRRVVAAEAIGEFFGLWSEPSSVDRWLPSKE